MSEFERLFVTRPHTAHRYVYAELVSLDDYTAVMSDDTGIPLTAQRVRIVAAYNEQQ